MKSGLFLLIVCFAFLSGQAAFSQCSIVPVDLASLSNESELVLEGRLSFQKTFRHTNSNIYSVYALQVASVYKGLPLDTVYIISLGGKLGLQITHADPSDHLGDRYGIFFLKRSSVSDGLIQPVLQFELAETLQGRIWLANGVLEDVFNRYENYEAFKVTLFGITHTYIHVHDVKEDETKLSHKRATPSISSFTPSWRSAGTDSLITITGSNFNASRGSGVVGFSNANDGGATFMVPLDSDYVSWTNTQIVVRVPTGAGTGVIAVQNSDPLVGISSSSLTVPYNLINAVYDNKHFGTRLQGLNSGRMTFIFNTRFRDSTRARKDFITSMQNWRCKSLVNWDTATSTSSTTAPSGSGTENLVLWDFASPLSSGTLGVAISNFSGCIASGDTFFFAVDIDVIFNDAPSIYTWEYGPGIPSTSQIDFESVAVHELGHGHQLGHVIDVSKVMHYAIGVNQRKNVISTQDSFGAKNIMAKNVVSVCGQTAMTALSPSSCLLVALPLEWMDFTGLNRTSYIELNWKVYREFEVEKYRVERSLDGLNFVEIGFIGAMSDPGNSSQVSSYGFHDRDLMAVKHGAFYRLSSMDYDGSEQSSRLLYIGADHAAYFYAKKEGQNIVLSSSQDTEKGVVRIFNALGQEIPYYRQGQVIVMPGVSNGIYYLVFQSGEQFSTQKMLLNF